METHESDSFFSRPPKLAPKFSLLFGLISNSVGFVFQGTVGGALVGAGIGFILMGIWDISRLRYITRRESRVARDLREPGNGANPYSGQS